MLTKLGLKNFKCFKDTVSIPLSNINLLTGINGRGKSTCLQALLLMRQSPEHSRTTNKIIFNGSCVELGVFDDVRNSAVSQTEAIELIFTFEKGPNNVTLNYLLKKNHEDEMVADIENILGVGKANNREYSFSIEEETGVPIMNYNDHIYSAGQWYNLFISNINKEDRDKIDLDPALVQFTKTHYVSADRIGPQDYYPIQSFAEFPNVGRRGEYTANVLSKKKHDLVHEQLCLEKGESHTILDQTGAWLSAIFDGGNIDIQTIEANIVLMKLDSEDSLNVYKPVNVGFGYSYALPIIVSGLVAQRGEILIVENPEAHLHPCAQSQITKFLAMVSASGVQVFIESHSDHVLNALRVAILDKIIAPKDLKILYFQRDEVSPVVEIPVADDGAIENWPVGFFDQTDKDFERLFGV